MIDLIDYIMLLYLLGVMLNLLIDPNINHVRHFIKITFINKGMEFIDLPSTFRDKSVQSAVPNYSKKCEVPIICYKYNKPIRSAKFNFNKVVSDLDIETCIKTLSDGFVTATIYDKRDDFDFDIVNFLFLNGDVPRSTSYGVYISQLIIAPL